MDAMALRADHKPSIALVDRDLDSRLAQPLSQTQAAEACTNHEYPEVLLRHVPCSFLFLLTHQTRG